MSQVTKQMPSNKSLTLHICFQSAVTGCGNKKNQPRIIYLPTINFLVSLFMTRKLAKLDEWPGIALFYVYHQS